eukprot:jgi/Bigna1/69813/fgenesh1_pg.10_\
MSRFEHGYGKASGGGGRGGGGGGGGGIVSYKDNNIRNMVGIECDVREQVCLQRSQGFISLGKRAGGKGKKFNKYTTGLKFVKKVPKFLQKMLQPSAEEQRKTAMKEAMKAQFRDLQDDEMPVNIVITNLEEFAHASEEIKALIRKEHMGEDTRGVNLRAVSSSKGDVKSKSKTSKREEDKKADQYEKETGKPAFRRKRKKGEDTTATGSKKKKKKKKKAKANSTLLSFDEPD